jgi:hypothetical protein
VEQEERADYISKVLEDAKKMLHSTRGNSGYRRDSMGIDAVPIDGHPPEIRVVVEVAKGDAAREID